MIDKEVLAEGVTERTAASLRAIAMAMAGGVAALGGAAFWFFVTGEKLPQPQEVKLINALTTVSMLWAMAAIFVGERLWKNTLAKLDGPAAADGAVQTGYILRLALREGAALLGLVVCLLAALNGVLRAFPAYWVNLAPAALFLFFLAARWPSLDNLRAQVRES